MSENKLSSEIVRCCAHKQYAEFICCKGDCMRQIVLCQKCYWNHEEHKHAVYKVTDMVNKIRDNILNASKGIRIANQSYDYFDRVIKGSQKLIKDQQNEIIKKVLLQLQKQKRNLFDNKKTIFKMKQKIEKQISILAYFKLLEDKNLLQIKIKTMSKKGVQNFKAKLKCFNEIKNDPKLIQSQFLSLQMRVKQLQKVMKNGLIQKVQEILSYELSRRSSLKKTQRTNHTDKTEPRKKRVNSESNLIKINKHESF